MRPGHRQQALGRHRIRLLLIVACCLLPFALSPGCGRKGDPRAPEFATPEPIKDLKASAGDRGISLTWTRPTRYVDGKELSDLAGFAIFRKDLSKSCLDCPVPYRQRAEVNVEDQEKFMKKKQYRFIDDELSPQMVYRYRVFSKLFDGSLSDPSNEVEAAWRP